MAKRKGASEDIAEKSKFEQTVRTTESNQSKYDRLRSLERVIKRNMKKEAPERLLLIVAHMLTDLEVEQSSFGEFMRLHIAITSRDIFNKCLSKTTSCFVLTVRWKRWRKH